MDEERRVICGDDVKTMDNKVQQIILILYSFDGQHWVERQ